MKAGVFIVVASSFEAAPILSLAKWDKVEKNIYRRGNNTLFICGIGKDKVRKAISFFETINPEKVINFGICGGVSGFKIGELFEPQEIYSESMLRNCNLIPSSVLISLEKPMKKPEDILILNPRLAFCEKIGVDMEAFFLKQYFDSRKIPIKVFKIFSDSGESDFLENFTQRKKELSLSLINVAKTQLKGVVI